MNSLFLLKVISYYFSFVLPVFLRPRFNYIFTQFPAHFQARYIVCLKMYPRIKSGIGTFPGLRFEEFRICREEMCENCCCS